MNSLLIMFVIHSVFHGLAILHHARVMTMYRDVCGKCDWWWEPSAKSMFACVLVPLFGPIYAVTVHVDIVRNIILELSKSDA